MESKIVKIANTENKATIIRYFSLVNNQKKKYICFTYYSGKNLNLSSIQLGYVAVIGDKTIIFKIENDYEWQQIKTIMENLFKTGSSTEIVSLPVDNIERIDIVSFHTFEQPTSAYSTFFKVKPMEEHAIPAVSVPTTPITSTPEIIGIPTPSNPTIIDQIPPVMPTAPVSNAPTAPKPKKGSRLVIILAIILVILGVAAALYYFRDTIFKTNNNPTPNTKNNEPEYADNELVCSMKYNDSESTGFINEKYTITFSDDKSKINKVKTEGTSTFTDQEEYKTKKQQTQMVLAFATMFGFVANINADDEKLSFTLTMEMDLENMADTGLEMNDTPVGTFDEVIKQHLALGYTCNGQTKEFNKDEGNKKIFAIDEPLIIIYDGWRLVGTPDEVDQDSFGMDFSFRFRHLNDADRELNAILTTYDSNNTPLSKTTINKENVKGNSYFTIDLSTSSDTEELVEDFDINNIKYYSVEFVK